MRLGRFRLELGVELDGDIPRMAGQFCNLDELAVGRTAGNFQTAVGERPLVQAVELVAVTMPLVDEVRAVETLRQRSRRELARVRAEPHPAAEVVDAEP